MILPFINRVLLLLQFMKFKRTVTFAYFKFYESQQKQLAVYKLRHLYPFSHLICNHFSREVVLQTWIFFRLEKSGSANLDFFSGWRKVVLQTWIFFSGSRKVVYQKKRWVYTINPAFFRLEKSGSPNPDFFFLVREKWLTRKKNPSLQNHFSRTTFLHFSRKVVAD